MSHHTYSTTHRNIITRFLSIKAQHTKQTYDTLNFYIVQYQRNTSRLTQ